MKASHILIAVLFLEIGSVELVRAADPAAQFKGYTQINSTLHDRVVKVTGWELGQYLGERASEPSPAGLLALLGTYLGDDTDAQFRNGDPNAMNLMLYYIAFTGFAHDVASRCGPPASVPASAPQLVPAFQAALAPICAWPQATAKADPALLNLWTSLMSFDAPQDEFEAWKTYFTTDPAYAQAPAQVAIKAMLLAALYNPYFLLRN